MYRFRRLQIVSSDESSHVSQSTRKPSENMLFVPRYYFLDAIVFKGILLLFYRPSSFITELDPRSFLFEPACDQAL